MPKLSTIIICLLLAVNFGKAQDVLIKKNANSDPALTFSNMPSNAVITINNHGTIAGGGGGGGKGTLEQGCSTGFNPVLPGENGGHAIATKTGVIITVHNYGIIAGSVGGGGNGKNPTGIGGGGGGAGIIVGEGGIGGGSFVESGPPLNNCVPLYGIAEDGIPGQTTTGGAGGAGVNGGAPGGNGDNRGQTGTAGAGNFSAPGGQVGKAIGGGTGNMMINMGSGQSFGTVD